MVGEIIPESRATSVGIRTYLGRNHYGTRPAKPNEANEKAEFSLCADVHSRNSTAAGCASQIWALAK
jgi:hypothetical protein